MSKANYETILNSSNERILELLKQAENLKNKFEKKENLTIQEKKDYDQLLKYIQGLNIILVHKQQSNDKNLEALSRESSKAIDLIINSPYNRFN